MAIFSPGLQRVEESRDKGLKTDALGLVSSVVMGVASTALAIIRPPKIAQWIDRGREVLSFVRRLTEPRR